MLGLLFLLFRLDGMQKQKTLCWGLHASQLNKFLGLLKMHLNLMQSGRLFALIEGHGDLTLF